MPDVDMEFEASRVFAGEDTLGAFVNALTAAQAGALYELLHARGCRWTGRGLEVWRRAQN